MAQELERLTGRCPHNREAVDVLAAAAVQMDKADRLCQGAEALLDMYNYEQKAIALLDKAENLLEEADQGVSEVDDLLCEAYNVEAEARAASDHAEQSLTLAMTQLRDPGQVLDLADSTTSHVQSTLRTEKPSAEVRDLRKRARKTRDKIGELRIRAHHT
jgi:ABC-type transporter Mla subunit MlaD